MDDEKNNLVENGAALEVYKKILTEYSQQNVGRSGFDAICPPEDQFRSAFTEAMSQRIGRGGNGDDFDQTYNEIHAKSIAEFLARNRVPPRDFNSIISRYKSILRLDEQVDRVLPERPFSLLSIIPGFGPDKALRRAKDVTTVLATTKERHYLTDVEAKALVEASLAQSARTPLYHSLVLGWTSWVFWKGRSTYRFPFYTPKPAQLRSLAATRYAQFYRGLAYFTVYAVFGIPAVTSAATSAYLFTIRQDPRLKEFMQRRRSSPTSPTPSLRQARPWPLSDTPRTQSDGNPFNQTHRSRAPFVTKHAQSDQQQEPGTAHGYDDEAPREPSEPHQEPQQAEQKSQQPSQQAYRAPSSQPPRNDGWDGPPVDDDDASPRAWSSQNQQGGSGAPGSAWDRVRQQSGYASGQTQGQQSRGAESSGSSWGANAGISPEYRGARESYSFSSADEGKAEPKSQAQREFDALLERERGGTDQG